MLKNLLDACFGAICFYFVGYGFAYGGDNGNKFIGYGGFVLKLSLIHISEPTRPY